MLIREQSKPLSHIISTRTILSLKLKLQMAVNKIQFHFCILTRTSGLLQQQKEAQLKYNLQL